MSIDLSLDRIRRALGYLPPYTRPTCHIAGTNGKGSVSALLSSIFRASQPLVVGTFNSPHLVSIYDSIRINGSPVSSDVYADARIQVEKVDKEHEIGLKSFEVLTATVLMIFERAQVDVVVMEVGMGGRLDATNVIPDQSVLVSALTAVDLDHQAFLGNTVAAIANEKAAIARPGKPFVLGAQKYPEVEGVVRDVVVNNGSDLVLAPTVKRRLWDPSIDGSSQGISALFSSRESPLPSPQPVECVMPCFPDPLRARLPLYGEHQLANLSIALGMVSAILTHSSCISHRNLREHITKTSVAEGIARTTWPGRLSFHTLSLRSKPLLVLADGAHNPASSATLASALSSFLSNRTPDRPLTLTYLLALSHSPPKTPKATLAPLFEFLRELNCPVNVNVALLRFTIPDGMPWITAVSHEVLRATIQELAPSATIWPAEDDRTKDLNPVDETRAALDWAAERVSPETDALVVVAGSLYLVADFYRILPEI